MQVAVGALSSAKASGAGLLVNAFGAVSLSVQGLFLAAGDLPGELPGGGGGGVSGVCYASFCSSRCLRALASLLLGSIFNAFSVSANEFLRSEEHTSELQSQSNLVCRLLLEKKKY